MATITLKNLQKKFSGKTGETLALDSVSLEIADRSFSVVTGPEGCGKTTLLRVIAGLEEVSSGEISIGDRDVTSLAASERDVAMVFPMDALYPAISVRQNIALGLKLRKFSATEIDRRVQDAAQALGVAEFLEARPSDLSAVQRQRVSMARAVARQPKVLLCDEPLAAFDAGTRAQLRAELRKLHERLETTIIYATADPAEAMALGERIVVLREGTVQQHDVAATVYDAPANLFVAGFLGAPPMNLIRGTLKLERDSFLFREAEEGTVQARIPHRSGRRRLERQSGRARDSAGGDRVGPGAERPGAAEQLSRPDRFRGNERRSDNRPTPDRRPHHRGGQQPGRGTEPSAGRRVRFQFEPEKAHFFDPDSGLRLA